MHDKNGTPINVGDKVTIVGTVISVASTDGSYCTVNVSIEGDWDGKGGTGTNWFSAKQVEVGIAGINNIVDDDNFGACTTDKNCWIESNARLCEMNFPNQVDIEDLSKLITKNKLFAIMPAFLVDGRAAVAKTEKFTTQEEAAKFANNMKVLYNIVRVGNEYIVRGWNE